MSPGSLNILTVVGRRGDNRTEGVDERNESFFEWLAFVSSLVDELSRVFVGL
jgi:hypothetical protein